MEKTWSVDDITRLYDTVAVGVIVVMDAHDNGEELNVEQLTARAEERIRKIPQSGEWFNAEWRERLSETIGEHIARIQGGEE